MSHFTVLVVGDNVEEQLAPFQEYGSSDEIDPRYLSFVDTEDEYLEEYREETSPEFYDGSSSSWGQEVSQETFDAIKSGATTITISSGGRGPFTGYYKLGGMYRCGVQINNKMPSEFIWIKVEDIITTSHSDKEICFDGIIRISIIEAPKQILNKEKYASFEAFVEDYHGHSERDPQTNRYGYWENKDKFDDEGNLTQGSKWDWYQIGGRWSGFFKLKSKSRLALPGKVEGFTDAEILQLIELSKNNLEKFMDVTAKYKGKVDVIRKLVKDYQNVELEIEQFPEHEVGESGAFGNVAKIGYADSCRKKHIDFTGMIKEKEDSARSQYKQFMKLFEDLPKGEEFEFFLNSDKTNVDAARELYWKQPRQARSRDADFLNRLSSDDKSFVTWLNFGDFNIDEETYVQNAGYSACSTFAVLKDGKWYERGKMGWWAYVSDEKSAEQWETQFAKLLAETPDETLLTIVDCHI